jgi:putative effector of murein hydrolase LrgA (UPF0299 family)
MDRLLSCFASIAGSIIFGTAIGELFSVPIGGAIVGGMIGLIIELLYLNSYYGK